MVYLLSKSLLSVFWSETETNKQSSCRIRRRRMGWAAAGDYDGQCGGVGLWFQLLVCASCSSFTVPGFGFLGS